MSPVSLSNHPNRTFVLERFPVAPIRCKRIIEIRYGDNPGRKRDLSAMETVRITAPVPFFVV